MLVTVTETGWGDGTESVGCGVEGGDADDVGDEGGEPTDRTRVDVKSAPASASASTASCKGGSTSLAWAGTSAWAFVDALADAWADADVGASSMTSVPREEI